jgi:hypothetical protein
MVYSVQAQAVQQREVRANRMTAHGRGKHPTDPGAGRYSHGPILQALDDGKVVIAQGMGIRIGAELFFLGIVGTDHAQETLD